jgi:hypothetical protein
VRPLIVQRLAKDQSDINRVIADVSKGSKFYEASRSATPGSILLTHLHQNEKKKDEELTKKIAHMLHLRDELTRKSGVDMAKIEATVDQLVCSSEISSHIQLTRRFTAPEARITKRSQSNHCAL